MGLGRAEQRRARLELAEHGTTVNTICPGFIQGDWLEQGMGSETYTRTKAHLEATTPLRLTTTPDTIADGILYFLEGADVITGETLMLDGGFHLNQLASGRR